MQNPINKESKWYNSNLDAINERVFEYEGDFYLFARVRTCPFYENDTRLEKFFYNRMLMSECEIEHADRCQINEEWKLLWFDLNSDKENVHLFYYTFGESQYTVIEVEAAICDITRITSAVNELIHELTFRTVIRDYVIEGICLRLPDTGRICEQDENYILLVGESMYLSVEILADRSFSVLERLQDTGEFIVDSYDVKGVTVELAQFQLDDKSRCSYVSTCLEGRTLLAYFYERVPELSKEDILKSIIPRGDECCEEYQAS